MKSNKGAISVSKWWGSVGRGAWHWLLKALPFHTWGVCLPLWQWLSWAGKPSFPAAGMAELSIFRRSGLISLMRPANGNRKSCFCMGVKFCEAFSCLWKVFYVLGTSVCACKLYPFPIFPASQDPDITLKIPNKSSLLGLLWELFHPYILLDFFLFLRVKNACI